jgi:hypothetical protein
VQLGSSELVVGYGVALILSCDGREAGWADDEGGRTYDACFASPFRSTVGLERVIGLLWTMSGPWGDEMVVGV